MPTYLLFEFAWAPNVWRIRFILNYKRVPYRTVWLEINEVEAAMHRIGAPASGSQYPARPVFPEGSRAVQSLFVHYVQEVFSKPLLALMVPLSHQPPPRPSTPSTWHPCLNVGDQRGDGVVVMGRDLSYADFALCSVLVWIERVAGRETLAAWFGSGMAGGGADSGERCREWMDEQ
ncbi:hypothetical protein BKA70DRAFT_1390372 [Coprinopsis sp. MPI-PUGE-AT-0042]|nr:hypothetical protein BKA70DRAFT_1390372 [Coprinopsis sp. MPI-PUGE-AT-0042]